MKKRAWFFGAVVVLALCVWVWASCDEAGPPEDLAKPEAPALASPEPVRAVVAPPPPTPPQRLVQDAGRRGWDLGPPMTEPPGTRLAELPSVVVVAVEAAQTQCERKVIRWLSTEAALMADLHLEATDAGVKVGFTAQGTPMLRCTTRLLEDERFDMDLPSQTMVASYFDRRKHRGGGGGVLPDVAEVLALVEKCAPTGVATAPINLSTTARVHGTEVVVDKPVIESVGLDAWARNCIELGLVRTVAFDEDSRPSWSSVTLELTTDASGKNAGASLHYEP